MFHKLKIMLPALILALFSFASCNSDKKTQTQQESGPDREFDEYKTNWLERIWRMYPDWAAANGYHKYDQLLPIPNAERRHGLALTLRKMLSELNHFKAEKLSANNRTDYRMMANFVQGSLWQDSVLKTWEWDPSVYNVGAPVAEILNGRYAGIDERLRTISSKIDKSPEYYEAAITSLKNPTLEHTQLAILQNKGGAETFGKALLDSIEASKLNPREKELLRNRIVSTKIAIESYVQHLEKVVLPTLKNGKGRSFRIGKEKFAQKFNYEIVSRYSAEEVYQKALARKKELHREMVKLSRQLWPKYFKETPPADSLEMVQKMISRLSEKHVSKDSFLIAIERQLPTLVKFVNDKNLLTQDPKKPLVVRKTPAYMEGGGAGASISAPGPYDKNANTYYNVTPLTNYSAEQAESYLREYNNYTLQILNIHEAIPGHYTQLVYSNRSPSIIKAVLGNGAMVEGWAVYAERMMLEEGYHESPEMWLMYCKWNLRVTLNAILDYSVHCLDMPEKDAMELLQKQGFQEAAEANGKWTRAKLSQVQLSSYFTAFTEIYDLREELKKQQGNDFNLKQFHEKFLSFGSAPVKFIRELMLEK